MFLRHPGTHPLFFFTPSNSLREKQIYKLVPSATIKKTLVMMVVFFFFKIPTMFFFLSCRNSLRVPSWPLRVDVVGLFIDGMELKTLEKSLKDSLLFVVCLFLLEKTILLYKLSVTVMISGRECFWRSWFSSWQSFGVRIKESIRFEILLFMLLLLNGRRWQWREVLFISRPFSTRTEYQPPVLECLNSLSAWLLYFFLFLCLIAF
jgi:hypothetical protein